MRERGAAPLDMQRVRFEEVVVRALDADLVSIPRGDERQRLVDVVGVVDEHVPELAARVPQHRVGLEGQAIAGEQVRREPAERRRRLDGDDGHTGVFMQRVERDLEIFGERIAAALADDLDVHAEHTLRRHARDGGHDGGDARVGADLGGVGHARPIEPAKWLLLARWIGERARRRRRVADVLSLQADDDVGALALDAQHAQRFVDELRAPRREVRMLQALRA